MTNTIARTGAPRARPAAAPMAMTLRGLAALVGYPDETLREHADEVLSAFAQDGAVTFDDLDALAGLVDHLRSGDLLDVQADWVDTFDRGRAAALYLFEHVHGESRDRGQAMVDLQSMYRADGVEQAGGELPDYLPVYLEWLSLRSPEAAREGLADVAMLLEPIARTLVRRGSPWAAVPLALLRLAGRPLAAREAREARDGAADDRSPEAIDAAYAETQVTFMGNCSPQAGAPREQVVSIQRNPKPQGGRS